MNFSRKILMLFFMGGFILSGCVLSCLLLNVQFLIIIFFIPLFMTGAGFLVSRLLGTPLSNFVSEMEMKHQEYFESIIDLDGCDEITRLDKLNNQLLQALNKTREELAAASDDFEKLKIDADSLTERETYFHRLFEHSNDAVFIYDFEGKLLDVNKRACKMLGYSKKELIKIPFLDLQIEEEILKSKAAFQTSRKTGSLRYESLMQAKDGQKIQVEISSSIVDLKQGIMQSIVSNITERKEMENSLRESEEKFRTFMETASDMMFITNEGGLLTYVNAAMIRALGYSRVELTGMPFHDLLAEQSLEISKQRRQQLLSEGEDVHEFILESKTRQSIIGEMKAVGIFSTDGKFKGFRGVFRDITERKKIETSQRLTQLGRLSADIAHEVKNQLMLVSTRAQIAMIHIQEGKSPEEDIETIIGQCKRINDVVKRLLQFSRPSQGDFHEHDINDSLVFVIDLVEKQFFQSHVEILKKLTPGLPHVNIDEKQMQEVFVNLMQNAYEAMTEGGLITIMTSAQNSLVQIEIKDTGPGIDEKDLPHIFDPFFTTKENGTGLGLSACFGIVQSHQGNIHYTSKKGEGTTVIVQLPAAESLHAQPV